MLMLWRFYVWLLYYYYSKLLYKNYQYVYTVHFTCTHPYITPLPTCDSERCSVSNIICLFKDFFTPKEEWIKNFTSFSCLPYAMLLWSQPICTFNANTSHVSSLFLNSNWTSPIPSSSLLLMHPGITFKNTLSVFFLKTFLCIHSALALVVLV